MDEHFTPITDTAALAPLFTASAQKPVILFKHDPYCPISTRAYQEMAQLAEDVAIIDVANDRDVARAIAERTGVRHESPQVIVLRDGKAVWSVSHYRIIADDVSRAAQSETATLR